MIKGTYEIEGCRTLAAAVIERAYKDLLNYNEEDRDKLERQILGGSLNLYFDVLNAKATPKDLIEKARKKRKVAK